MPPPSLFPLFQPMGPSQGLRTQVNDTGQYLITYPTEYPSLNKYLQQQQNM